MKSALMDAGLLILILVGTAGAEGTAQLTSQLQKLPQSFLFSGSTSTQTNAIRVNTVSNNETTSAPAAFHPQTPVPLSGKSEVRVSTFRPAYNDAEPSSIAAISSMPTVASENKDSRLESVGVSSTIQFSPPITYGTPRPVVSTASAKTVQTTTYAPVVEIPNEGRSSPPIYSPTPTPLTPVPITNSSTYYGSTPTPTLGPSYTVPATSVPSATLQVPAATTVVPSYAYRPAATWVSMPNTVYVGRGIIGQPTVYVPRQPIRNFFRYISP